MAKKKTTVIEEEIPNEYKDIHETSIEDIVGAPSKEEKAVEESKAPETLLKEEVKEEEIPFDPEAYKKEVLAEAAELIEKTTGTKEVKNEVDTELQSPWAKENRTPKDYEEVADWAVEKKAILDKRAQEEYTKQQAEQKKIAEETNKKQIDDFNKFVDEQLNDLYASGKLPKDEDSRKALFQAMLDVNVARSKAGKAPIYSIKEIFYEHYKAPNAQPAGADAPVSPSRSGAGTDMKELDYNDIHKRSFFDILSGK